MVLSVAWNVATKNGLQLQQALKNLKCFNLELRPSFYLVMRRGFSTLYVMSSPSSTEEPVEKISTPKFHIPQHNPSKLDKMTLIATRTMKAEDIGDEVSLNVMEKANTRRRIGVNISLMIFTLFGSMFAVWQGKKEMKTENIYEINKRR